MTAHDPLGLLHRIHVSTTTDGYAAACTCGWRTVQRSRELRDVDCNQHLAVPRSRGSHGVVSEGD